MTKIILPMLGASVVSVEVFFLTLLFSVPLGFPLAAGRISHFKPLSYIVNAFLLVIRGTPLILQLIAVYFVPAYLFKISYDRFIAAIIALSVNYACYFAEIYRGGIVLPQVVKRIVPAMGNEVITLVKDTALVSVLGIAELFRTAQTTSSRLFSTTPILIAGLFYFVMNWVVSACFILTEKKLDYYK